MKKKITINDIAKELKTTASTVSRALNDNPRISPEMRKLIQDKAEELGYQQNVIASALRSGKSGTVGVIIPLASRSFFSSIIGGIEEELSAEGYRVIFCQSQQKYETEKANLELLMRARVDGIMISLTNETVDTEHLQKVVASGMPLVLFDKVLDFDGANTIVIDDFAAVFQSAEHLLTQGCRRLVYVSGDTRVKIYKERLRGFKAAMEEFKGRYDSFSIFDSESEVEAGRKLGKRLLGLSQLPDGIISSSDYNAAGIMKELLANGIRIPEDVCITGFSNASFTELIDPALTTIDQRNQHMGKMAARLFLELLHNPQGHIERSVVLKPRLLVRKSSNRAGL